MTISITVTGDSPELIAAHVGWLADKLGSIDIVEQVIERKAKKTADKAIDKAKESAAPAPAPSERSADTVEAPQQPEDVATATVSAAPSPADKAEVQRLAQAKSKLVGVEKVKATIATYGGTNINTTPADKLAELKTALEALQA